MEWQNSVTEKVKGMLVTNPGMAPAALRVDQLDREQVSFLFLVFVQKTFYFMKTLVRIGKLIK